MKKKFYQLNYLLCAAIVAAQIGAAPLAVQAQSVSDNTITLAEGEELSADMLEAPDFNFNIPAQEYTGDVIEPIEKIGNLTAGTDYTVTYSDNVNVGRAKAEVRTKANEKYTYYFSIVARDVSDLTIDVAESVSYTGSAVTPEVTVYALDGETVLREGADYTISYMNNTKVGDGLFAITGMGNYGGTYTGSFAITETDLSKGSIAPIQDQSYTGALIKPALVVKTADGHEMAESEYTVVYTNNKNVGTAKVTVMGKGGCSGSLETTFSIVTADIAALKVDAVPSCGYTGKEVKPSVVVRHGNTILKKGTDYTVSYTNNVKIGTASIIIRGIGNYTGSQTVSFEITRAVFKQAEVSYEKTFTYTGKAICPEVTVEGYEKGKDYTVSYRDNVNAGTGIIQLRRGTQISYYTFTITKASLTDNTMVSGIKNLTYTGKALKQGSLKVKDTVRKKQLTAGVDYKVTYKKNTNVGTATITITGKGNYTGTIKKTFQIKPGQVKISKVTRKNSKLTAKVKKMPGVSGYEIQASKSKKFKNARKATDKTTNVSVGKCTAGSTWYVRVRAYYVKDGKTYYGKWSKIYTKN